MRPLVLYHGGCTDGFGAAWAAHRKMPAEFHEVHYGSFGSKVPEVPVAGRDVYILDFSYPRATLDQLAAEARSVIVLDHHKSAQEDLAELPSGPANHYTWEAMITDNVIAGRPHVVFDMERSGAGIAWDFFHPHLPRPWLINAIEDRDLWRFKRHGSRQIHAVLGIEPRTLEMWDNIIRARSEDSVIEAGEQILKAHDVAVQTAVDSSFRWMSIAGVRMPVANVPHSMSSDAGNLLVRRHKQAAATYYDANGERRVSLRSSDEYADVSVLAKQYGGGGHRNAAGFKVPLPPEEIL